MHITNYRNADHVQRNAQSIKTDPFKTLAVSVLFLSNLITAGFSSLAAATNTQTGGMLLEAEDNDRSQGYEVTPLAQPDQQYLAASDITSRYHRNRHEISWHNRSLEKGKVNMVFRVKSADGEKRTSRLYLSKSGDVLSYFDISSSSRTWVEISKEVDIETSGTYSISLLNYFHSYLLNQGLDVDYVDISAALPITPRHPELDQSLYDPKKDLLSLHYDMLFDADDIQAVVAAKMMLRYYDIDAMVVAGTKSHKQRIWNPVNGDTGLPSATTVLNVAFPSGTCSKQFSKGDCGLVSEKGWVNAGDHWNLDENAPVVSDVAAIWKKTLDADGKIFIAEGGMGDFTVDVANWLVDKMGVNRRVVKDNVISVQHSNWNMEQSGDGTVNGYNFIYGHQRDWKREPSEDYQPDDHFIDDGNGLLQSRVTHMRVNDGNGPYGNGGTEGTANAQKFWSLANNGDYSAEWDVAQFWGSKRGRVDFSDTVELVYILGVHDDIKNFNPRQDTWINFIEKYNYGGRTEKIANQTTRSPKSATPTWTDIWGSAHSPISTLGTPTPDSGRINVTATELRFCFKNNAGPIEVFEVNAYQDNVNLPLTVSNASGWVETHKMTDGLTAGKTWGSNRASHFGDGFQCVEFDLNRRTTITNLSINHDDAGSWRVSEVYAQFK